MDIDPQPFARAAKSVVLAGSCALALVATACDQAPATPPAAAAEAAGAAPLPDDAPPEDVVHALRDAAAEIAGRPERDVDEVTVRHLLISFAKAEKMPNPPKRTRVEAERLAAELLQRIRDGGDFAALVREHSDDSKDGVYRMCRSGARPAAPDGPTVIARGDMVQAFGDVSWRLDPGEVGVAAFDPEKSPFGWHIIQRIE